MAGAVAGALAAAASYLAQVWLDPKVNPNAERKEFSWKELGTQMLVGGIFGALGGAAGGGASSVFASSIAKGVARAVVAERVAQIVVGTAMGAVQNMVTGPQGILPPSQWHTAGWDQGLLTNIVVSTAMTSGPAKKVMEHATSKARTTMVDRGLARNVTTAETAASRQRLAERPGVELPAEASPPGAGGSRTERPRGSATSPAAGGEGTTVSPPREASTATPPPPAEGPAPPARSPGAPEAAPPGAAREAATVGPASPAEAPAGPPRSPAPPEAPAPGAAREAVATPAAPGEAPAPPPRSPGPPEAAPPAAPREATGRPAPAAEAPAPPPRSPAPPEAAPPGAPREAASAPAPPQEAPAPTQRGAGAPEAAPSGAPRESTGRPGPQTEAPSRPRIPAQEEVVPGARVAGEEGVTPAQRGPAEGATGGRATTGQALEAAGPAPGHDPTTLLGPHDPPPTTSELGFQKETGTPVGSQRKLAALARENGVLLDVRPTNPEAPARLAEGHLPKPEAIKAKSINELDTHLGFRAEDKGLVGYRMPDMPDLERVPAAQRDDVMKRYHERAAEFADLGPTMTDLQRTPDSRSMDHHGLKGTVTLDEHGVLRTANPTDPAKPQVGFTGDHDVFQIRDAKTGEPIVGERYNEMVAKLRAADVGVEHGAHMHWGISSAQEPAFRAIAEKHSAPAGAGPPREQLVTFGGEEPVRTTARQTMDEAVASARERGQGRRSGAQRPTARTLQAGDNRAFVHPSGDRRRPRAPWTAGG